MLKKPERVPGYIERSVPLCTGGTLVEDYQITLHWMNHYWKVGVECSWYFSGWGKSRACWSFPEALRQAGQAHFTSPFTAEDKSIMSGLKLKCWSRCASIVTIVWLYPQAWYIWYIKDGLAVKVKIKSDAPFLRKFCWLRLFDVLIPKMLPICGSNQHT